MLELKLFFLWGRDTKVSELLCQKILRIFVQRSNYTTRSLHSFDRQQPQKRWGTMAFDIWQRLRERGNEKEGKREIKDEWKKVTQKKNKWRIKWHQNNEWTGYQKKEMLRSDVLLEPWLIQIRNKNTTSLTKPSNNNSSNNDTKNRNSPDEGNHSKLIHAATIYWSPTMSHTGARVWLPVKICKNDWHLALLYRQQILTDGKKTSGDWIIVLFLAH